MNKKYIITKKKIEIFEYTPKKIGHTYKILI